MASGNNPNFANALVELKTDGGVLTVVTHGARGAIEVNRKLVKGFGAGTGRTEECLDPPIALAGARRNVVVNMVVCSAADDGNGITSVSKTLSDEIVRAGGSVATMNASRQTLEIKMDKSYRALNGYDPGANPGDRAKLNEALATALIGVLVKDRHQRLQTALDDKVGAGKVAAVIRYKADIVMQGGNVTIQDEDWGLPTALDEDVVTETEGTCAGDCSPTPALQTTWGAVRALYR